MFPATLFIITKLERTKKSSKVKWIILYYGISTQWNTTQQ